MNFILVLIFIAIYQGHLISARELPKRISLETRVPSAQFGECVDSIRLPANPLRAIDHQTSSPFIRASGRALAMAEGHTLYSRDWQIKVSFDAKLMGNRLTVRSAAPLDDDLERQLLDCAMFGSERKERAGTSMNY